MARQLLDKISDKSVKIAHRHEVDLDYAFRTLAKGGFASVKEFLMPFLLNDRVSWKAKMYILFSLARSFDARSDADAVDKICALSEKFLPMAFHLRVLVRARRMTVESAVTKLRETNDEKFVDEWKSTALSQLGQTRKLDLHLKRMVEEGKPLGEGSKNAQFIVKAENNFDEAWALFQGFSKPTLKDLCTILISCLKHEKFSFAPEIQKKLATPHSLLSRVLIEIYVRDNKPELALEVFSKMKNERTATCDEAQTWAILAHGLLNNSDSVKEVIKIAQQPLFSFRKWETALKVFQHLNAENITDLLSEVSISLKVDTYCKNAFKYALKQKDLKTCGTISNFVESRQITKDQEMMKLLETFKVLKDVQE